MNAKRGFVGLVAGMLSATLATATAIPDPAQAQTRDTITTQPGVPPRASSRDASRDPARGFTTTVRPATGGQLRRIDTQPALDPAQTDAQPDPNADPSLDGDDPPRPRTRRPIPVDGDPNWPPPKVQPVDGIIVQDDRLPTDGIDPNTTDQRTDREADEIEGPPAGHDPRPFAEDNDQTRDPFAFEIEVDPLLDRRPARFARFEPYDPIGIKVGGFVVFPESEFALTAYDNIFRSSSNVRRDVSFDVRPSIRAVSNWRSHAMEFRATGVSTFHNEFSSEDDRGYLLESRGRIDITRRTNIEMLGSHERNQEQRGSIIAASATGSRANVETDRLAATFNHRFNRLAIQLRGTLTETDYGSSTDTIGGFVSNDARDTTTLETAARATWLFKPNFGIFGEVAHNTREYKAAPADNIQRDSSGDRVSVGVSFNGNSNNGRNDQKLRGEVSIGHQRQEFDDRRLPSISGIVVDANLGWRVSALTSVLFTARSTIGESTLPGSGGALSQSYGVELRHAFRRYLIGTAALRYTTLDYEGLNLKEHDLTSQLGLEYYVNRNWTLFSRYQHVTYESTDISRNYNADEFRVGVRVRQ